MTNTYTIGVGELDQSIATIIAAKALGHLKANTVLAQLVNRDFDEEVAVYGQVITIPIRGTLAAHAKSDDTVVTQNVPTDTAYTVTLNQHYEVTFRLEDIGKALARPDYLNGYIEDGLKVLSEQIDTTIGALYSGLSQTIDASTGLTEAHFREARRLLNSAKAPLSDRWFVLHEDAEKEALGLEKLTNRDYTGDAGAAALRDGYLGRYAGFNLAMSQNIPVSTTCKNLAFQRDAMVLATRPLPAPPAGTGVISRVMSEDGVGIRVLIGYNMEYLATQVTIDALWGVAEMRDAFGVVISTTEV